MRGRCCRGAGELDRRAPTSRGPLALARVQLREGAGRRARRDGRRFQRCLAGRHFFLPAPDGSVPGLGDLALRSAPPCGWWRPRPEPPGPASVPALPGESSGPAVPSASVVLLLRNRFWHF